MIQSVRIDIRQVFLAAAYALLMLLAGISAVLADDINLTVELNKGAMVKLDRPASSVVIADPETADVQVVSPKLLFVRGKTVGETSLYAVDQNDDPIMTATVDVTHNLSSLRQTVKRVAPDADITFKTVDGGLVMDGYAASVDESEKIRNVASAFLGANDRMVNMIKTGGSDQVMLKVKLVEMSRTDLKNIGVNLQNVTSNGNFAWQVLQGSEILFHTADPDVNAFSSYNSVLARGTSTNTNALIRYKDVSGLLDALETQGLAHVLAEPSLTTTSGQAASFLAGGQFPLPVFGNNNTVTLDYQPFGVSLNFTPVVLSQDRISLTVAPEVSTLNFNNPIQVSGVTYPILDTRRASAVVELGSGDSFVLAGLLKNESSNNIAKFPGVGDIPVLGALFRSTQFQNNQTELVILVTPYIVRPVADPTRLQTPIDGYKPPSDLELLMKGSLYQQQSMDEGDKKKSNDEPSEGESKHSMLNNNGRKNDAVPKLHGEGGFILE
jgi:pilus assembly protein CpaC